MPFLCLYFSLSLFFLPFSLSSSSFYSEGLNYRHLVNRLNNTGQKFQLWPKYGTKCLVFRFQGQKDLEWLIRGKFVNDQNFQQDLKSMSLNIWKLIKMAANFYLSFEIETICFGVWMFGTIFVIRFLPFENRSSKRTDFEVSEIQKVDFQIPRCMQLVFLHTKESTSFWPPSMAYISIINLHISYYKLQVFPLGAKRVGKFIEIRHKKMSPFFVKMTPT